MRRKVDGVSRQSGPSGLAVFGGVVEADFAAGALLGGVDDAGVEGAGVDVEADGALVEFARI